MFLRDEMVRTQMDLGYFLIGWDASYYADGVDLWLFGA